MTSLPRKAVICTHFAGTGNTEELRDWLNASAISELIYIAFPFSNSESLRVTVSSYQAGKLLWQKSYGPAFKRPEPVAFVRDLIVGFYLVLRFGRKSELFIGGNNLLALIGLACRALGCVRRVVYYMIDYTPKRFPSPFLNEFFYAVDRFVAYRCDKVWPLIPPTIEGRAADGRLDLRRVNWHPVPYGCYPLSQRQPLSPTPFRVVYLGGLFRGKGPDLFVPIAKALQALVPDLEFHVVGGGPYFEALREEVSQNQLESHLILHGYIDDYAAVLRQLDACHVAVAPYRTDDPNSFTRYADAGKLKVYLGRGLPVVLTGVPPLAAEISASGSGIVVPYDANAFATAIVQIRERWQEFQNAALNHSRQYDWNVIFTAALKSVAEPKPSCEAQPREIAT